MLARVGPEEAGGRLDVFVSGKGGVTRSRAKRLVEGSFVKVNGKAARASHRVREGDEVEITMPGRVPDELVPEDIAVEVLFSDRDLVVVDKPAGLVVYPGAGHPAGTLMNALRFRFGEMSSVGAPLRPGVVHRLDKDTSGVMVVALSDRAYYSLVGQFKQRKVGRTYLALVHGSLKSDEGEISARIGRSASDRKKMSTRTRRGKEARTFWKVAKRLRGATLVSVRLATGRTHQVRVHFASAGHPVLGDGVYGRKTSLAVSGGKIIFPRQMLHAESLCFAHPETGAHMQFRSPLPRDMAEAMERLSELN